MNTTIQKWGNSQGVRLPKIILDQSGMNENDKIQIFVEGDSIILKKAEKKHLTLQERLENFYGKPLNMIESIESQAEISDGGPVGEEVW